jgi:hypothetical protein
VNTTIASNIKLTVTLWSYPSGCIQVSNTTSSNYTAPYTSPPSPCAAGISVAVSNLQMVQVNDSAMSPSTSTLCTLTVDGIGNSVCQIQYICNSCSSATSNVTFAILEKEAYATIIQWESEMTSGNRTRHTFNNQSISHKTKYLIHTVHIVGEYSLSFVISIV